MARQRILIADDESYLTQILSTTLGGADMTYLPRATGCRV